MAQVTVLFHILLLFNIQYILTAYGDKSTKLLLSCPAPVYLRISPYTTANSMCLINAWIIEQWMNQLQQCLPISTVTIFLRQPRNNLQLFWAPVFSVHQYSRLLLKNVFAIFTQLPQINQPHILKPVINLGIHNFAR